METKQLKINVPEGYEIDKEKSTFENIVFKPIKNVLTYQDVANDLFYNGSGYYISTCGDIVRDDFSDNYSDVNNCVTDRQAEKLLAINKLMNVAKYLNGDWKPNLAMHSNRNKRYYIYFVGQRNELEIGEDNTACSSHGQICFKTKDFAIKAIEILGEDVIKLALCVDY